MLAYLNLAMSTITLLCPKSGGVERRQISGTKALVWMCVHNTGPCTVIRKRQWEPARPVVDPRRVSREETVSAQRFLESSSVQASEKRGQTRAGTAGATPGLESELELELKLVVIVSRHEETELGF